MPKLIQLSERPQGITVESTGVDGHWAITNFIDSAGTRYVKKQRRLGMKHPEIVWFIVA